MKPSLKKTCEWFYGFYGVYGFNLFGFYTRNGTSSGLFSLLSHPSSSSNESSLRHQKVEDELGKMVAQRDLKFDTATWTSRTESWVTCGRSDASGWKLHLKKRAP